MKNFKPEIRIFWQKGVKEAQIELVAWAIKIILDHANATDKVKVTYGKAVDLQRFKEPVVSLWNGYLDADAILDDINEYYCGNYHSVLLVKDHIFFVTDGKKHQIVGMAQPHESAIIYVDKPNKINDVKVRLGIAMASQHETSHVFYLPPWDRTESIILSFNKYRHCANLCVMYPNISIADKIDFKKTPLCQICLSDLRNFFNA